MVVVAGVVLARHLHYSHQVDTGENWTENEEVGPQESTFQNRSQCAEVLSGDRSDDCRLCLDGTIRRIPWHASLSEDRHWSCSCSCRMGNHITETGSTQPSWNPKAQEFLLGSLSRNGSRVQFPDRWHTQGILCPCCRSAPICLEPLGST